MLQRISLLSLAAFLTTQSALAADDFAVQGTVVPLKEVSMASPVFQEIIESMLVKEGDMVKESQPVVQLRREREVLAVEQARKKLDVQEWRAKASEKLWKEKINSEEAYRLDKAQFELGKIELAAAEDQLKQKTVLSPIGGVVTKRYKEPGESVDRAEKLLDIVNTEQVYVRCSLAVPLPKLEQNAPIRIKIEGVDGELTGKLDFIAPSFDKGGSVLPVKILLDNPGLKIKAGMKATAYFSK